jgi:hypothetical protein
MVLGEKREAVEVTSSVLLVQSQSATLGTVVEDRTIRELPLSTRNVQSCVPVSQDRDGTVYGNLGRGAFRGPHQANFDTALTKTTKVGGLKEGALLQFRTEFFSAVQSPAIWQSGHHRGC